MRVIYSREASEKVRSIQMIMGYLESAGPIFGRFDIQNGEQVLIVSNIFDRTVSRGLNHSDTSFNAEGDFEIEQEIAKGNNWIGTWHTHTPWSYVEKEDGTKIPIGLNFSEKDLESFEKMHKEIGIKNTLWLLITKDRIGHLLKGNE